MHLYFRSKSFDLTYSHTGMQVYQGSTHTCHTWYILLSQSILLTSPTKNTDTSLGSNPTLEESAPLLKAELFITQARHNYTHLRTTMHYHCTVNVATHSNECFAKQEITYLTVPTVHVQYLCRSYARSLTWSFPCDSSTHCVVSRCTPVGTCTDKRESDPRLERVHACVYANE